LAAAEPPGRATASLATAPGPGSLQRCRGLPGVASVSVQAFSWLTETNSSLDLTRMVKERGPQHRGCCMGGMTLRQHSQTKRAQRRSAGCSSGSRQLELCLLERVKNIVNRKFFSMQKLIWQNYRSSKNCLSRVKTSVFPRPRVESKKYPG
jgi:hypothetical protein